MHLTINPRWTTYVSYMPNIYLLRISGTMVLR